MTSISRAIVTLVIRISNINVIIVDFGRRLHRVFLLGNDDDGQLGHGQESTGRKKNINLPKSLSFEVLIKQISCGVAHTSFISSIPYKFL